MKKILILNAPNDPFTDEALLIEPIDVLTVASWVKSLGYQVTVRDLDREQLSASLFSKVLVQENPELVIIPFDYHIPLYTTAAISGVKQILEECNSRGLPVILGGRPAQYYPNQFITALCKNVVIIKGEMELAIADILKLDQWNPVSLAQVPGIIYWTSSGVQHSGPRKELIDLERIPIADRSCLPIENYIDVRTILSSRGCVERCSFCPVHKFWGKWRRRSAEHVVAEIEYLVQHYAARKILFLDDHATVEKKRLQEISKLLRSKKLNTTLGCLGTAQSVDRETLSMMYAAGFRWIHFGAEFGSDRVLKSLNKRTSVAALEQAVEWAKAAGLRVRTSWILDAPHTSLEDLDRTLDLIVKLEPHEVRAHFLAIRAGAPLAETTKVPQTQYIHSDLPRVADDLDRNQAIMSRVNSMAEELESTGYHVVRDPGDWGLFSKHLDKVETKFISFCPGRYGLGWEV